MMNESMYIWSSLYWRQEAELLIDHGLIDRCWWVLMQNTRSISASASLEYNDTLSTYYDVHHLRMHDFSEQTPAIIDSE